MSGQMHTFQPRFVHVVPIRSSLCQNIGNDLTDKRSLKTSVDSSGILSPWYKRHFRRRWKQIWGLDKVSNQQIAFWIQSFQNKVVLERSGCIFVCTTAWKQIVFNKDLFCVLCSTKMRKRKPLWSITWSHAQQTQRSEEQYIMTALSTRHDFHVPSEFSNS